MAAVRLERQGGVAVVTLDRPDKLNAFDLAMIRELRARVAEAAEDPAVGCLLLTGAGKAFCAGGDVAQMLEAAPKDPKALFLKLTGELHPVIKQLCTTDKPVVGAINGAAAGGGYGLALACDLRLAAPEAKFKAAYFALGIVPDGGVTHLLPRLVGPGKARELILLDKVVGAEEALALGLVNRVVPREHLLQEAMQVATRLAEGPRHSLGRTKQLFARSHLATLDEQLRTERAWNGASAALPDFQEGVRAFVEKRPPRFPSAAGAAKRA